VVLTAKDNNATSTSTDESSIKKEMDSTIRSGQDSKAAATAGVDTTLPAGGDVACKVDKSILVITHVLRGALTLKNFLHSRLPIGFIWHWI
jgi:hypothetical protein